MGNRRQNIRNTTLDLVNFGFTVRQDILDVPDVRAELFRGHFPGFPGKDSRYRDYACTILATLCTPEFLAVETPGWEGILKHGMYHQRKGRRFSHHSGRERLIVRAEEGEGGGFADRSLQ